MQTIQIEFQQYSKTKFLEKFTPKSPLTKAFLSLLMLIPGAEKFRSISGFFKTASKFSKISKIVTATVDGELVGSATLIKRKSVASLPDSVGVYEITDVAVVEKYRRQSIATSMLALLITEFKKTAIAEDVISIDSVSPSLVNSFVKLSIMMELVSPVSGENENNAEKLIKNSVASIYVCEDGEGGYVVQHQTRMGIVLQYGIHAQSVQDKDLTIIEKTNVLNMILSDPLNGFKNVDAEHPEHGCAVSNVTPSTKTVEQVLEMFANLMKIATTIEELPKSVRVAFQK